MERSSGRFKVKTVAETLGVSRSNLIDRIEQRTKARGPYHKAEDGALLPLIRAVVDERLTYGYRRVTALVNRKLRQEGKPTVNAKRVLRIMQCHTPDAAAAHRPAITPNP